MAIANSSDILQAVIEATPDAIFVKDLEGRYILVNDAAARFLGRSPAEIVGKRDPELYPQETARQFIEDDRQVLATGQARAFEGVATGKDGARQAYLVTKGVYRDPDGRILGLFGISHDITELQAANESLAQAREALFRSQKMEAVGQLTGGIAHDFNNILSVILGNIELLRLYLQRKKRPDPQVEEMIDSIIRATLHGKDLTSQLLAFSGRRHLNPQPIDTNALVTATVRMLSRTIGASIDVKTDLTPNSPIALVDAATLEAAILNIALNARDAMPDGGALTIRTLRAEITEPPHAADDLAVGSYAVIALEDSGCGMSADVAARVFEPFFTTKSGSGGTGLGLSMVYGFARQSGGVVTIESEPGRGTIVRVFLPIAPTSRT
jgi:two-component system, cell cycle sensor histidine kinase and response regulator CckA